MRRSMLFLWAAGLAFGLAAESVAYRWDSPRDWVPDLATGWTLIACGLIAWSLRSESMVGPLMTATGFAWFAGNLSDLARYLHRGPLVHLVLAYPSGRVTGRVERAAVAAGYVVAAVPALWNSERTSIVMCSALVGVAARGYVRAIGEARRERLAALQATTVLASTIAATAAVRLAVPTTTARHVTLSAYEGMLCVLALVLLAGLFRAPWERAALTDLIVEVGETRPAGLRDVLARLLGDPTLEVGYWLPDRGIYVDKHGLPLDLATHGDRRLTPIERDGQRVAALVHDAAVLDDPLLVDAVAAAARLSATNARLQAEVHGQLAELQTSRRRLVHAGDVERGRLEELLRHGALRRLEQLRAVVGVATRTGRAGQETQARLERAAGQLDAVLIDLRELAKGLHPRVLGERGLSGALAALAETSHVPVELATLDDRLPPDVEAAAYFVCSEALANAAKHAAASRVTISVQVQGEVLRVVAADDGVGGADARRGTGLRGLADRVEAVGGSFAVDSPPGGGTRLRADIPLSPSA